MTEKNEDLTRAVEDNKTTCTDTTCCPAPISPIRRDTPKIGRNDPCICGNGSKYKKCCGKNA